MKSTVPTVLVVDDEPDLLKLIELTLTKLGLVVVIAGDVAEAKERLAERSYDLCLTDMRMPDGTGIDVLNEIQRLALDLPTAVITAHGNTDNAVAALKAGAFDYLAKPVSLDQLRALVKGALAIPKKSNSGAVGAEAKASAAIGKGFSSAPMPGVTRQLLGSSPAIERLRELLARLAQSNAPVHIHGESGTGKELAARILHESGPRAAAPFVAVNCGAIPETLMETEFFGAKKGAFTGANDDRIGFFQAAEGGTLFLDEVADLPLTMQVKLLRAIQERTIRKVGSTVEEPVDVRIVSATHKSLETLVTNGTFRQDLFYRLSVIPVTMPALREVRDDVGEIAVSVLQRIAKRPIALDATAIAALSRYDFPGNVRELENILERALALSARPDVLTESDLQLAPRNLADHEPDTKPAPATAHDAHAPQATITSHPGETLQDFLDRVEKEALLQALASANGNRTQAARALAITFRSMRYRLERLGLDVD